MRYFWCEDSKSGYRFWSAVIRTLYPDICVESKGSNSGLRKAVRRIASGTDQYYIIMDAAMDNPDVLRENRRLAADVAEKGNVHVISVHSFEYALLSFELLEQWVFAESDTLKEQRQSYLNARALFVDMMSADAGEASGLAAFKAAFDGFESKNSEQIAAKLLYEITRNTGFETDKSRLGECFVNSCCEWDARQSDDICGLDAHRINANEKARLLVERSALKNALEGVEM